MAHGREVATNRKDERVADAISELIADVLDHPKKEDYEVWIATAYFNPGGYGLLADQLERVASARLLLGAEPVARDAGPRSLTTGGPREQKRAAMRRALEGHGKTIEQDRDLLGFQYDA